MVTGEDRKETTEALKKVPTDWVPRMLTIPVAKRFVHSYLLALDISYSGAARIEIVG